jgi:hypothetical protein
LRIDCYLTPFYELFTAVISLMGCVAVKLLSVKSMSFKCDFFNDTDFIGGPILVGVLGKCSDQESRFLSLRLIQGVLGLSPK